MKQSRVVLTILAVCILVVSLASQVGSTSIATGGYHLYTPLPIADFYVGRYSNNSYFAINGSTWDNFIRSTSAVTVIQATIEQCVPGSVIRFDGEFEIGTTIVMDNNDVGITLDCYGATFRLTANTILLDVQPGTSMDMNVTIRGGHFIGRSAGTSMGIRFYRARNCTLEDANIENMVGAAAAVACSYGSGDITIRNCWIHDSGTTPDGITLTGALTLSRYRIEGCRIGNCGTGVMIDGCPATTTIMNCEFYGWGGSGNHAIYLDDGVGSACNAIIDGCHFHDGLSGAAILIKTPNTIVSNNEFRDLIYVGLSIYSQYAGFHADRTLITGNAFYNVEDAIWIGHDTAQAEPVLYTQITGNSFDDVVDCINFRSYTTQSWANYTKIAYNVFHNCTNVIFCEDTTNPHAAYTAVEHNDFDDVTTIWDGLGIGFTFQWNRGLNPDVESYSYLVTTDGTYTYGEAGDHSQVITSTDATYVINLVFGNLTSGRSWKERILLVGSFTLSRALSGYQLLIPSHTTLEVYGNLYLANSMEDAMIYFNGVHDVEVIGGTWNGNGAGQSSYGSIMDMENSVDITIRDTMLLNAKYAGVSTQDCDNVQLLNNQVYGGNIGFYLYGTNSSLVANNNITDTSTTGIKLDASSYDTFMGNTVYSAGSTSSFGDGLKTTNASAIRPSYNTFIGNAFLNCSGDGADIYASLHSTFTGNTFKYNGWHAAGGNGFHFAGGCDYITFEGNIVNENAGDGVALSCYVGVIIESCTIANNEIYNNNGEAIVYTSPHADTSGNTIIEGNRMAFCTRGVWFLNISDCVIDGNIIWNTSSNGIQLRDYSQRNIVSNNRVFNSSATGINEYTSYVNYNTFINNVVLNNTYDCSFLGLQDVVIGNVGYNPIGLISSPVSGSYLVDSGSGSIANNTAYTCSQSPKTIYMQDADTFDVKVNGELVCDNVNAATVTLQPGDTFEIEWVSALTILKVFGE